MFSPTDQPDLLGFDDPGMDDIPPYGPALYRRLAQNFTGDPIGKSQLLTVTTVVGLTVPDVALSCVLSVETEPVRLQLDGTPATQSKGLLLPVGQLLTLTGRRTLKAVSLCDTSAGASTVNVLYFT